MFYRKKQSPIIYIEEIKIQKEFTVLNNKMFVLQLSIANIFTRD